MEPFTLIGAMLVCGALGAHHAVTNNGLDWESFSLIVLAVYLAFMVVLTVVGRAVL